MACAQPYGGQYQPPQPVAQSSPPSYQRSLTDLTLNDLGMLIASNIVNFATICVGLYFLWGKVREALLKAILEALSDGKLAVTSSSGEAVKLTPRELAIAAAAGRQILVDAGYQVT
ncbi:MAG: hypothetical protein KGR26_00070, partial [Cyanobacteria bacterium REEB65]|nr:hypothetical protein [Cyanobacteria bacterium REEB65]